MGAPKIIDQQITSYLPQLSDKQKNIVLGVVRKFADDEQDWWNKLSPNRQAAIDEAIGQIKAGKGLSHASVMKKYQKWRAK
ncbi:MAG: hypothetical protein JNK79_12225 [Chitinophagaceae bacterium]|nr:hypothetical protein [Chitinophagaceae bacterium]